MEATDRGELLLLDISAIWSIYCGEAAAENYSDFYKMNCDTLIWDICIMGGEPAYLAPRSSTDEKIDQYVAMFNHLISSTIGWKRYTFCTVVEVRGTVLVLADLSLYPPNFFM